VKPGDRIEISGVPIDVVPSYNRDKKFHPKDKGWVGYIFTLLGKRIYLAGDTDYIPEMKDFRADVALLPVSGTYVMTAEEAVQAALDINPEVAIPMHYGSIVGSEEDAQRFAEALRGRISVTILKRA
jgi:L-ascorbate metabolism protein UlaG (beta-lactamase superfamily)